MSGLQLTTFREKHLRPLLYIGAVLVFSRFCFWVVAYLNDLTLIEGLCRWDCHWYLGIVENGYDLEPHANTQKNAANWPFFPVTPFLIWIGSIFTGLKPAAAGFFLSNIFIWVGIHAALQYLKATRAVALDSFWIWLCTVGPYSFYFSTSMSESFFFCLASVSMLFWAQRKYVSAGGAAALLSATRIFGVVWAAGWVTQLLIENRFQLSFLKNPRLFFALCISPFCFFLFSLFLYGHTGDGLTFIHMQKAWSFDSIGSFEYFRQAITIWDDGLKLFAQDPNHRVSFAYYNCAALVGIILTVVMIQDRRFFEATIALAVILIASKTRFQGLPRYLVGTPVFFMALHDLISRFNKPVLPKILLTLLALFNLWLLLNWYENARFLF